MQQKLKAELVRSTKEKAGLMEGLKDTEMHFGVLREAQVSCRGSEREAVKRSGSRVGWLAVTVIPKAGGTGQEPAWPLGFCPLAHSVMGMIINKPLVSSLVL